jgi:hypothetical protein
VNKEVRRKYMEGNIKNEIRLQMDIIFDNNVMRKYIITLQK